MMEYKCVLILGLSICSTTNVYTSEHAAGFLAASSLLRSLFSMLHTRIGLCQPTQAAAADNDFDLCTGTAYPSEPDVFSPLSYGTCARNLTRGVNIATPTQPVTAGASDYAHHGGQPPVHIIVVPSEGKEETGSMRHDTPPPSYSVEFMHEKNKSQSAAIEAAAPHMPADEQTFQAQLTSALELSRQESQCAGQQ